MEFDVANYKHNLRARATYILKIAPDTTEECANIQRVTEPSPPVKRIDRSPRYPAIDLQTALNRVVAIYRREGKHVVPNEVAARHWGLSPKSSSVLTTTAALRAYGLLADGRSAGTAGVALTDLGLRLAADERGVNPDRPRLLREAALKPSAFLAVWTHYGGSLPSDDLLEYHLKTDRGFTHEGARAFIRNLRATLRFAGVEESGTIASDEPSEEATIEPEGQQPTTKPGGGSVVATTTVERPPTGAGVQVPIARGEWATIVGPFPMPKAKWEKFLEMLKTMEFALVDDGAEAAKPTSESDPTA